MRLAAALFCFALSTYGADEWLRLKSPNFELYTTAGEGKGKQAIRYFEQMRGLFQRFSGNNTAPRQPVRLTAFRNDKEYAPYRPSETAAAYYLPGNQRDYIVMRSIADEFYPLALHEYTHLIVKHSGARLPVWLNEGIAELYASTRPYANKIQIGAVLPSRAAVLSQSKFIPLDQLFSAGHDSPFYNEKDRAGMFYAQSWLLTHMLHFSPDYRPKAQQFLGAVGKGKHAAEAFFEIYGKSTQGVEKDLQAYLRSDTVYAVLLDGKLEKSAEAPEITPASAFETGMILADLLSNMRGKREEAAARYRALAASNPGQPEVEEALGWLALRGGRKDAAIDHFQRAAEAGSKSPKMYFDFAMLSWERERGSRKVVDLLKRVVQLDTNFPDGHWQLAMAALNARDYATAGVALAHIRTITPDRAFQMFEGMARVHYEAGRLEEAGKSASRAKEHARTPSQLEYIMKFQQAIEYKANPGPRLARREQAPVYPSLEGALRQLDCSGEQARLHVETAGKRVVLLIRDPANVQIRNTGDATYEFTCGPQKGEKVKVEFAPQAAEGAVGYVVSIEFVR
ncbi:MAG: hypothetical protein SFV51_03405 [Bryobacteraceae bacterium]|nr:hypothetical protein [Bryobacteraceae bacterium]